MGNKLMSVAEARKKYGNNILEFSIKTNCCCSVTRKDLVKIVNFYLPQYKVVAVKMGRYTCKALAI